MTLSRIFPAIAMILSISLAQVTPAQAQIIDPFENGWTLDPASSQINFLSVKKGTIAESSQFATFSGVITPAGQAQIRVLMDSVDTKIDLRNVRMRFLFFETFKFPEATITAQLPADQLVDLVQVRRKIIPLTVDLSLHGIAKSVETQVSVTLMNDNRVAVASTLPIVLALPDFALEEGRAKLQEAASVDILPFGFTTFDFVFDRSSPGTPLTVQTASAGAGAALETKGNFDRDACLGRFEILSKTGSIYFGAGSARLTDDSRPLLENLADIVRRCPDLRIEVGGHTDSDGGDHANKALSERRARSVVEFLQDAGIEAERLTAVGYGEDRPVVPNDSAANKARNRRIEFSVTGS